MPTSSTDTRHLGCGCGTSEAIQEAWLKAEDRKLTGKNRKRTYLHFDKRIGKVKGNTAQDVWSAEIVSRHSFLPLIKVVIEEKRFKKQWKELGLDHPVLKKPRNIAYASHFDALIYSWYAFLLNHFYNHFTAENGIDENVIAYRDNKHRKNNLHFALEVFDFVKSRDETTVACFDIKGFFDSLDHAALKTSWKKVLAGSDIAASLPDDHYAVFKAIKSYIRVERDAVYESFKIEIKELRKYWMICTPKELREKAADLITSNPDSFGIPQGTPISAVLSNIYMIAFDKAVNAAVTEVGGLYRRYSDDILVAIPSKNFCEISALVKDKIALAKLIIQDEKTHVAVFTRAEDNSLNCVGTDGKKTKLTYLGAEFDGKHTDIRHRSFARYQRRRVEAVKRELYKAGKYKIPFNKGRLLRKFSHSSDNNFVSYLRRAAAVLGSTRIKKKASKQQTTFALAHMIKETRMKRIENRNARSVKGKN